MNVSKKVMLTLGLAAILAAPALAQQRPGGRGGPGGPGGFGGGMGMQGSPIQALMAPPVHAELGLSEEQIEKIRPIGDDYRDQMRSRMQELRGQLSDLSPEERRERFESVTTDLNASARERLEELLSDEQLARLDQIQRQQQGVSAFADPDVQQRLDLSDEQKAEIEQISETYRTETRALMQQARQAQQRGQFMERMTQLRRGSMDKALGVLTEEQRSTWSELIGEPFEMGPPGPRGRRGPGGGRRPDRN